MYLYCVFDLEKAKQYYVHDMLVIIKGNPESLLSLHKIYEWSRYKIFRHRIELTYCWAPKLPGVIFLFFSCNQRLVLPVRIYIPTYYLLISLTIQILKVTLNCMNSTVLYKQHTYTVNLCQSEMFYLLEGSKLVIHINFTIFLLSMPNV